MSYSKAAQKALDKRVKQLKPTIDRAKKALGLDRLRFNKTKQQIKADVQIIRAQVRDDQYKELVTRLRIESYFSLAEAKAEAHEIVYGVRSHEALRKIVKKLPQDYDPWGKLTEDKRGDRWADCSSGCRFYIPLEHHGADWGVCCNPKSHRSGLLTFEHQGCLKFQATPPLVKLRRK